ncbi:DUF6194 family protein [Herbiconiux ginsengi]|uniref:DUF6194 family protein n=1 Tax=Herbiconiux ginsengi TaxID=381665 RepID=UPI001FE060E1|nr:DUF6194 family protein [Herbiconiux ginsengi]
MALPRDFAATDVFFPHPVHGPLTWVSVVNPATTMTRVLDLLRAAHSAARARTNRHHPDRIATGPTRRPRVSARPRSDLTRTCRFAPQKRRREQQNAPRRRRRALCCS